MRVGMSWPAGRGRRQWISVGPAGLLVLTPFWLAGWLLWLIAVAVYGAGRGIGWLFTHATSGRGPREQALPRLIR